MPDGGDTINGAKSSCSINLDTRYGEYVIPGLLLIILLASENFLTKLSIVSG